MEREMETMKTGARGGLLRISAVLLLFFVAVTVRASEKKEANPSELGATAIGAFVSDAVRDAKGADVGLVAASSLGSKSLPKSITEDNIADVIPFGSEQIVAIKLTGADLRAAVERSVSFLPRRFGGFLQVSGLSFTCDLSLDPGERVTKIKVGGASLDDEAEYTVALSEFLADGGNGYASLRKGEPLEDDEGAPLGDIILNHGGDPSKAAAGGRITIIEPE